MLLGKVKEIIESSLSCDLFSTAATPAVSPSTTFVFLFHKCCRSPAIASIVWHIQLWRISQLGHRENKVHAAGQEEKMHQKEIQALCM